MDYTPRFVTPTGVDLESLIARAERIRKVANERHAAARLLQGRPTLKAVELAPAARSVRAVCS